MNKLESFVHWIFTSVPSLYLIIGSTILFLVMTSLAFVMRAKSAQQPTTVKKIVLPPLFMSTGALMFLFEEFRVPFSQVIEAFCVGLLFSIILIRTTTFEQKENGIYVKRSKAFIIILFSLLLIRLIAKLVLSTTIDVGELGGMFWILAFGMIVPWRIGMLVKFNRIHKEKSVLIQ